MGEKRTLFDQGSFKKLVMLRVMSQENDVTKQLSCIRGNQATGT